MMRRVEAAQTLKLVVSYDGTEFAGWQVQPGERTVQGELEAALGRLLGRPVRATAAGRTDAGVHAEGQVVSFPLAAGERLPARAFVHGLNGLLPEDLAVRSAGPAPAGFDARRSARGKLYRYRIANQPVRAPLDRRTHWLVFQPLDLAAMRAAATDFLGEHDFSALRAADCPARTAVRRLDRVDLCADPAGQIVLEIRGTAFLKHMVRAIAGTLVEVGRGRFAPDIVPGLLAGRNRALAGPTAPAHGLCLVEVYYE